MKHGAQIDAQDKVSDERQLNFSIDARVTMALLYEYDIRKVILHFILHVKMVKLKQWNIY